MIKSALYEHFLNNMWINDPSLKVYFPKKNKQQGKGINNRSDYAFMKQNNKLYDENSQLKQYMCKLNTLLFLQFSNTYKITLVCSQKKRDLFGLIPDYLQISINFNRMLIVFIRTKSLSKHFTISYSFWYTFQFHFSCVCFYLFFFPSLSVYFLLSHTSTHTRTNNLSGQNPIYSNLVYIILVQNMSYYNWKI